MPFAEYCSVSDNNIQIVPSPSNSGALSPNNNSSSLNWLEEDTLTLGLTNCLSRKVKPEPNDLLDMSLLDGSDLCSSSSNMFQIHNNNNNSAMRLNPSRKVNSVSGFSSFPSNNVFTSDNSSWLLSNMKRETSEEMDFNPLCNGLTAKNVNNLISSVKAEDHSSALNSVYQQGSTVSKELDQVHSLALEACTREIDVACENLGISADPFNWNNQDVRNWLIWQREQCKLPGFLLDRFNMDGMTLCTLSESDFKDRAPGSGETLHAQLEIWKTAANLTPQSYGSFKADDSFIELNTILNQWAGQGLSDNVSPSSQLSIGPLPQISISNQIDYHSDSLSPSVSCSSPSSIGGMNNYEKSRMNLAPDARIVTSDYGSEGTQSDDEISEDGCEVSSPSSIVNSPRGPTGGRNSGSHIHLWQFLKELLENPQEHGSCIRWTDRSKGIFKIEDSVKVARLWGKRKNRPAMNYDKLSRSIRQYYKKGIMKKTERSQRLVYQFCHPYGV